MELWSHPSLIYRFPDSLCSYNLHQFTSISHDFAESPTNLKTCWMAEKSIRCRLQLSTCLERPKSAGYPGLVAINHEIILIFCFWEAPSLFVSTHIKHHLTWLHKWIPNNNSPNYLSQNISPKKKVGNQPIPRRSRSHRMGRWRHWLCVAGDHPWLARCRCAAAIGFGPKVLRAFI